MPPPSLRAPAAPRRPPRRGDSSMRVKVGAFELVKKGAKRYDWHDPYHVALALNWRQFALLFLVLNLAINLLFALLFSVHPNSVANARPGHFLDLYFFSMETLATVGYGVMAPADLYGHIVASAEIITGLAFTAIMTGLTFVRFSRPRPDILYAANPVVASHNGRPMLMIRIANGRASLLTDAQARLTALISEHTLEGQFYRRIHELKLERDRVPIFGVSWTLMHALDDASPLRAYSAQAILESDIRLFVTIEARDTSLNSAVHDMKDYGAADVRFGMRYMDAVSVDDEGRTIVDLERISLLEPDNGTSHVVVPISAA